jgi:hypothetical protein
LVRRDGSVLGPTQDTRRVWRGFSVGNIVDTKIVADGRAPVARDGG